MSTPPGEDERRRRTTLSEAFLAFWRDYPWATRAATVALIAASVLNLAIAAGLVPERPLLAALACDGTVTLLTLVIALGVGLHLKQRQLEGLLDGTEHYDIGRALAYGYFSNFLVPALLLVRAESRARGSELPFRMVFPRHIGDLDHFKDEMEPALRAVAGKRDLEGVYRSGAGIIKRSLLVLGRSTDGDIFFDFPTTLYTLHDYYDSWNLWLEEQGKPTIDPRAIEAMQERQISAFLRHLTDLSRSEVGLAAVRPLGLTEVRELSDLFDAHFRTIGPRELPGLLEGGSPS